MRRFFAFLTCLVLIALFTAGCGLAGDGEKTPEVDGSVAPAQEVPQIVQNARQNEELLLSRTRVLKVGLTFLLRQDEIDFMKLINPATGEKKFPEGILEKFDKETGLYLWEVPARFFQSVVFTDHVASSILIALPSSQEVFHLNSFLEEIETERMLLRVELLPNARFDSSADSELLFEGMVAEFADEVSEKYYVDFLAGVIIFERPKERHITIPEDAPSVSRGSAVSFKGDAVVYITRREDSRSPLTFGSAITISELFPGGSYPTGTNLPGQFYFLGTATDKNVGSPVYFFDMSGKPVLLGIVVAPGPRREGSNNYGEGDVAAHDLATVLAAAGIPLS